MFIEIVFTGLPIDRDEVEEALEAAFGSDGEITGAGNGMGRRHLARVGNRSPRSRNDSRPSRHILPRRPDSSRYATVARDGWPHARRTPPTGTRWSCRSG